VSTKILRRTAELNSLQWNSESPMQDWITLQLNTFSVNLSTQLYNGLHNIGCVYMTPGIAANSLSTYNCLRFHLIVFREIHSVLVLTRELLSAAHPDWSFEGDSMALVCMYIYTVDFK